MSKTEAISTEASEGKKSSVISPLLASLPSVKISSYS